MTGEIWKYAALSELVYKRDSNDDPISTQPLGYTRLGELDDTASNGFYGEIYIDSGSTEIVVVYHYGDSLLNP